jgi:hypothetical protein
MKRYGTQMMRKFSNPYSFIYDEDELASRKCDGFTKCGPSMKCGKKKPSKLVELQRSFNGAAACDENDVDQVEQRKAAQCSYDPPNWQDYDAAAAAKPKHTEL